MKSVWFLPLLLVLTVGMTQAHAESIFDFGSDTDHPDRVTLFGIVEVTDPDDAEQILLQIIDSDDNMVFRDLVRPDREGEFAFWVDHDELSGFGEYEAKILYFDDAEKIDFEIEPFIEEIERTEKIICEEGDKLVNGACVAIIPNTDDTETTLRAQVAGIRKQSKRARK